MTLPAAALSPLDAAARVAGGALGYFGADGAFELATALGIGVLAHGELRVHVGSTLVADSDAAAALAETERAAAPWIAALDQLARAAQR